MIVYFLNATPDVCVLFTPALQLCRSCNSSLIITSALGFDFPYWPPSYLNISQHIKLHVKSYVMLAPQCFLLPHTSPLLKLLRFLGITTLLKTTADSTPMAHPIFRFAARALFLTRTQPSLQPFPPSLCYQLSASAHFTSGAHVQSAFPLATPTSLGHACSFI